MLRITGCGLQYTLGLDEQAVLVKAKDVCLRVRRR